MDSICGEELIEINGLCSKEEVRKIISENPYWKQLSVNELLTIPSQKPDMETINSITISINIIRKDVIKTPRSYNDESNPAIEIPSYEGRLLSGRKIIVEGVLCQKIIYTADEDEQPVNSVCFYVPFSSYIVVPKEIAVKKQTRTVILDSLDIKYEVNSCVEDIYVYRINGRELSKKVTFLLYAIPTGCC